MMCLIHILGWLAYLLPDWARRAICLFGGAVVWYGPFGRRRVLVGNIQRAFPDKPHGWCRAVAKESCARLVELGMFVLVSPHLSKAEIRKRFRLDESLESLLRDIAEHPAPLVILVPHFTLMEAITLFPALTDIPIPNVGVLYRPQDNGAIDDWVKRTRERWGIRLLSRKDELMDAPHMLRDGGALALLFDQNAGGAGATSLFLGRVCSTTKLPGIMAARFKARVGVLYAERTGFFRATIRAEEFKAKRPTDVIVAANRWLEKKLAENADRCADWLWAHNRWGRVRPNDGMSADHRASDALPDFLEAYGVADVPNPERALLTLPESPDELEALLPILMRLRENLRHWHIEAFATDATLERAREAGVADAVVSRTGKPLAFFAAYARKYPTVHFVFENSIRADIEARRAHANVRVGVRGKFPRPLLTQTFPVPAGTPAERWRAFARRCGMWNLPA